MHLSQFMQEVLVIMQKFPRHINTFPSTPFSCVAQAGKQQRFSCKQRNTQYYNNVLSLRTFVAYQPGQHTNKCVLGNFRPGTSRLCMLCTKILCHALPNLRVNNM